MLSSKKCSTWYITIILYLTRSVFKLNKNEMFILIHSLSHNCFNFGFLLHPYKIRLETWFKFINFEGQTHVIVSNKFSRINCEIFSTPSHCEKKEFVKINNLFIFCYSSNRTNIQIFEVASLGSVQKQYVRSDITEALVYVGLQDRMKLDTAWFYSILSLKIKC